MTDAEKILSRLVAFPVLGGQSNLELANWIKDYIEGFGVKVHEVYHRDKSKKSLHCRIGPAQDGGLILSGHMDVVPTQGQEWHSDPFVLTEKEGKWYGRGSSDMKGFLACCLAVLPSMVKRKGTRPIYLAFSYDEEIGCLAAPDLAQDVLDTYTEKPAFALIGEPSLLEPMLGQKGIYVMEVEVKGSAGHSSRIRQEVSAIHEAARLILWLEQKMDDLVQRGHLDSRFDPPHSSIHIGKIAGGVAHNIIADRATFCCDLRTIPQDKVSQLIADFRHYCDEREADRQKVFPGFTIQITEDHPAVPPLDTSGQAEIVALMEEATGRKATRGVSYAAEAGQFAEKGFQTLICGPGCISRAHRADEFISKQELADGVAMIQRLGALLCGKTQNQ